MSFLEWVQPQLYPRTGCSTPRVQDTIPTMTLLDPSLVFPPVRTQSSVPPSVGNFNTLSLGSLALWPLPAPAGGWNSVTDGHCGCCQWGLHFPSHSALIQTCCFTLFSVLILLSRCFLTQVCVSLQSVNTIF